MGGRGRCEGEANVRGRQMAPKKQHATTQKPHQKEKSKINKQNKNKTKHKHNKTQQKKRKKNKIKPTTTTAKVNTHRDAFANEQTSVSSLTSAAAIVRFFKMYTPGVLLNFFHFKILLKKEVTAVLVMMAMMDTLGSLH